VFSGEDLMPGRSGSTTYYGDLRAVDVAVRRLREKLEDNPTDRPMSSPNGAGLLFCRIRI
jgi:two-component system response regulator VicR